MPSIIRILMVEDFEPFRRSITSIVQNQREFQVICEVSDGLEAVRKAAELQPDLVLLDIGLPGLNGIEVARRVRGLAPQSKIVFLSQESSPEVVRAAFELGAWGYVVKSDAGGELLDALSSVLRGKKFVSSSLRGEEFDPCLGLRGDPGVARIPDSTNRAK